jgi:hypothetical protein
VDTSVHRLQFTADQVTREKVGVAVTGLAVFRVVAPEVAFRMLDLARPDAHEEILREMFVGATRRLVANLALEDCLTRRKDALAAELMAEVAPVVSGRGAVGDSTDRGWGVAIDTIEVQDVRVLSNEVFERLQAPYRATLALEAGRAQAEVDRAQQRFRVEREQADERHRLELFRLEEERVAAERDRARAEAEEGVRRAELEAAAVRAEAAGRADATRAERAASDGVSEARLREIALTDTLPRVAEAFRGSFDHVTVHSGDLGFLGQALAQVFDALRSAGVKV